MSCTLYIYIYIHNPSWLLVVIPVLQAKYIMQNKKNKTNHFDMFSIITFYNCTNSACA